MTTNTDQTGEFLTNAEEHLFEEYKIVLGLKVDADKVYSTWEQWFTATEAVLIVAVIQLIKVPELRMMGIIVSFLGAIFSVVFFLIQSGNYLYAHARSGRLEVIEKLISKKIKDSDVLFLQIMKVERKEREMRWWYKYPFTTTWSLRKAIPIVFFLFWCIVVCYFCSMGQLLLSKVV